MQIHTAKRFQYDACLFPYVAAQEVLINMTDTSG